MIFNELWNAFNDIYFEEGPHTYTDSKGTKYTSVTTLCKEFEAEKDWDLIAEKASIKHNKPKEELQKEWKYSGDYATTLGTEIHAVMEYLWQNKDYAGNKDKMCQYEGMLEDFEYRKKECKEIFAKLKQIYIPIKNEFIVYDQDWKICGTIDFLAYNKIKNCYSIIDWKTSKKFDKMNKFSKLKPPFSSFDDCNCNHYSIQLSTYKAILEKHCPNIKIEELVLIQLPKEGTKPEVFKCHDFSERIKCYLNAKEKV